MPNRNIFPKWKGPLSKIYKHSQEWQRGCSNCCTFCSPTRMQKNVVENGQRKVRVRDINNIKDEIENGMRLKPGDHLFSVDLNTSAIPKKDQRELFSYLKKKGIRWYTEGTTSPLLEDYKKNGPEASLLSLMSARETLGGCYSFLYGVDDLISNKVAGSRDKDIQTLMESVKIFREMGVPINLSVVMGLDNHHYPDSFFQAAEMLQEVEAPYTFLHIATPYPGTTWGQKAYDEGKVFGTESTHFNHRKVVASPKNMTADELQQGYYWLMRTLSNPKQLAQTAKTNLKPGEFVKNPTLGVIQSGLPFGLETHLTTLELKARGYIDASIQNELDRGYKNWKSRSLSLSPQL